MAKRLNVSKLIFKDAIDSQGAHPQEQTIGPIEFPIPFRVRGQPALTENGRADVRSPSL